MKALNLSLSEGKLKSETLHVKDTAELLDLVIRNFKAGAYALYETPKKCCLEEFSGSSAYFDTLNALTVCSSDAELRAEKSNNGFDVRILSDSSEGESVLCRQIGCYLRTENNSTKKMLVKEYFVLDEQTGMPVKQYERMCGAV